MTLHHPHNCPCDPAGGIFIPSFVGEDVFCESGYVHPGYYSSAEVHRQHSSDILWDARDCHSTSTCCSFNNPPYFTKTLNQATTDDLELRMCLHDLLVWDDIAVELIELYHVK